jgi:hypothetical protein
MGLILVESFCSLFCVGQIEGLVGAKQDYKRVFGALENYVSIFVLCVDGSRLLCIGGGIVLICF